MYSGKGLRGDANGLNFPAGLLELLLRAAEEDKRLLDLLLVARAIQAHEGSPRADFGFLRGVWGGGSRQGGGEKQKEHRQDCSCHQPRSFRG